MNVFQRFKISDINNRKYFIYKTKWIVIRDYKCSFIKTLQIKPNTEITLL